MELVQIIMYSLQIFIVTLFTLILSAFVAYKFRKRERKTDTEFNKQIINAKNDLH